MGHIDITYANPNKQGIMCRRAEAREFKARGCCGNVALPLGALPATRTPVVVLAFSAPLLFSLTPTSLPLSLILSLDFWLQSKALHKGPIFIVQIRFIIHLLALMVQILYPKLCCLHVPFIFHCLLPFLPTYIPAKKSHLSLPLSLYLNL